MTNGKSHNGLSIDTKMMTLDDLELM